MTRLTDASIRAAVKKPRSRQVDLPDGSVPGLFLRLGAAAGDLAQGHFSAVGPIEVIHFTPGSLDPGDAGHSSAVASLPLANGQRDFELSAVYVAPDAQISLAQHQHRQLLLLVNATRDRARSVRRQTRLPPRDSHRSPRRCGGLLVTRKRSSGLLRRRMRALREKFANAARRRSAHRRAWR